MLARLCIYIFYVFNTGIYTRISSEYCKSHGKKIISSKEKCEASAQSLGLVDTEAHSLPDAKYPKACIYADNNRLFWNRATGSSVSVKCGYIDSNNHAYDCICSTGGNNSQ